MESDALVEKAVLRRLRGLPGVRAAEAVPLPLREELRNLATPQAAENRGVETVLSRQCVACLFKGRSFRGPPGSSLIMVDDQGTLLGRELTGPDDRPSPGERRTVYLGRDFVLIAGVRPTGRLRFVLPPLPFPELDDMLSLAGVVSASPDPPQDARLCEYYHIERSKDLASILIGFDVQKG